MSSSKKKNIKKYVIFVLLAVVLSLFIFFVIQAAQACEQEIDGVWVQGACCPGGVPCTSARDGMVDCDCRSGPENFSVTEQYICIDCETWTSYTSSVDVPGDSCMLYHYIMEDVPDGSCPGGFCHCYYENTGAYGGEEPEEPDCEISSLSCPGGIIYPGENATVSYIIVENNNRNYIFRYLKGSSSGGSWTTLTDITPELVCIDDENTGDYLVEERTFSFLELYTNANDSSGNIEVGCNSASFPIGWCSIEATEHIGRCTITLSEMPEKPVLSHSTITTDSITWTWKHSRGEVTNYEIYEGAVLKGTRTPLQACGAGYQPGDPCSFTETGLSENIQYTRKVRAINGYGNTESDNHSAYTAIKDVVFAQCTNIDSIAGEITVKAYSSVALDGFANLAGGSSGIKFRDGGDIWVQQDSYIFTVGPGTYQFLVGPSRNGDGEENTSSVSTGDCVMPGVIPDSIGHIRVQTGAGVVELNIIDETDRDADDVVKVRLTGKTGYAQLVETTDLITCTHSPVRIQTQNGIRVWCRVP